MFSSILHILFLFAWAAALAVAQEAGGTIEGRVADSSGASVAGAAIVARHADTGAIRQTTSGSNGTYALPGIPIGAYDISATHPGFKKSIKKSLQLHVSEHLGADFTLEVGELTQEVSVTANVEQVQTESSEQGGLITGEQVRELQLNGRNFLTLLELIPGVASGNNDRSDPHDVANDVSVNGARTSAGGFGIDGSSNPSVVGATTRAANTSVESVAEFRVLTSNFSAEYGRGGISQVNAVTKSGTKQFHGSAYEFVRNDAFDANDYFSHRVLPLKLNNFGYTLGGPVLLPHYNRERNKTFFFVLQEWNWIASRGEAVNTTVPGEMERRGDFSALAAGAVLDPTTKAPFPGNIIPASRINPDAAKLLSLFPVPNFQGPGVINYTSAAANWQKYHQDIIRIDHNFSPSVQMYVRYLREPSSLRNPYGGLNSTSANMRFPGIGQTTGIRAPKNLIVSLSTAIRPTLINEFKFNYARRKMEQYSTSTGARRSELGIKIPEIFPENEGNLVPAISLGSNYASLGPSRPSYSDLMLLDFSDNLTKIVGRHVIKTGFLYYFGADRERQTGATNGSFSFNTSYSRQPIANLLLGLPYSYTEAEKTAWSDARFPMIEAFVQDDVRATNRLTLNIGVRYSAYISPYDRDDLMSNFLPGRYDPARAPRVNPSNGQLVAGTGDTLNGMIVAGVNSPFGRAITESATRLFAPRFGFSWAPFSARKTAIRGGYGLYFTRPIVGAYMNTSLSNPPFTRTVTIQEPTLNNPSGGAEAAQTVPSIVSMASPMRTPLVQQWSFGVQHEVLSGAVLNVSYVGSRGTRLVRPLNINDPQPGAAARAGVSVNAVRPYVGYGAISERQSTGSSNYHSLQVSFNRRMTRQFSAGIAYTFSKAIDIASSDRSSTDIPPNSGNIRAERGPADSDRTHVFTGNLIWNLPGAVPAASGWSRLFNGWQISGIVRMWSGRPFDVTMSSDVANIGSTQNQRPDITGDTKGPRTVENWFNRSAFGRPASYTFGNMGRNSLRGPGVNKWDMSLFKNFILGLPEKLRFQFRAEAFNIFNHPSFTTVGTSLNTTTAGVNPSLNNFGVVTATRDARVLQLALKMSF